MKAATDSPVGNSAAWEALARIGEAINNKDVKKG